MLNFPICINKPKPNLFLDCAFFRQQVKEIENTMKEVSRLSSLQSFRLPELHRYFGVIYDSMGSFHLTERYWMHKKEMDSL